MGINDWYFGLAPPSQWRAHNMNDIPYDFLWDCRSRLRELAGLATLRKVINGQRAHPLAQLCKPQTRRVASAEHGQPNARGAALHTRARLGSFIRDAYLWLKAAIRPTKPTLQSAQGGVKISHCILSLICSISSLTSHTFNTLGQNFFWSCIHYFSLRASSQTIFRRF